MSVDTSTAVSDAYPSNNVRAAATFDGTGFWMAGTASSNAGVRFAGLASTTSAAVFTEVTNMRSVKVVEGQLYASTANDTGAGVPRVFAVGVGLPQSLTTQITPLDGVSLTAAGDFALLDRDGFDGPDTLYVVETGNGVGVRGYTKALGTWTETSSLHTPATVACIGVAARSPGSTGPVTVLCSGSNGAVYRWDDEGNQPDGGFPAAATLITAPAGTAFRGLGF